MRGFSVGSTLLTAVLLAGTALAQAPSGKLVLYTSQPQKDAQETIAAFTKAVPGVQVDFVRDGTTQLMSKLRAEFAAGAPQPDLLLIADAMTMEQLKAENRLAAYQQAPVAGLPEGAFDKDFTYFGTKFITTGIIYNTKAKKPESWKDLLAADAKGQVVLPSPLYSGAAAIHMGTLGGLKDIGLGYFESLAQNGAVAVQGNGQVRTQVAGGQKLYGIIVDFMGLNAKKDGSPVDFVFPKEGVTVVTEPVALLSTAKNPAAAKAFIDFILSAEGQKFAASQGYLPMRADVPAPEGFPARDAIKVLPAPVQSLLKDDQANKKRFADAFGG
ncbi:ABC transporter substrate-binding protein [Elstera cyanobacteriorum]|uniref:ABC transporter substrate-binding protein n=1 Tax=Elstera cyanobacteriorum TaxID=2022747 RepID=UPI002354467B|nr:ABC transporter substrate-binding protein [Elstera cyanobacteriorum]MCK6442770.1 ABC transporter substrate-binding protein [Elstera cyanobacteriorum]